MLAYFDSRYRCTQSKRKILPFSKLWNCSPKPFCEGGGAFPQAMPISILYCIMRDQIISRRSAFSTWNSASERAFNGKWFTNFNDITGAFCWNLTYVITEFLTDYLLVELPVPSSLYCCTLFPSALVSPVCMNAHAMRLNSTRSLKNNRV